MEVRLRIHPHPHAHPDVHPNDEALEEYSFGRLPEGDLSAFEEHLLICESCQDRVQEFDEYLSLTKFALAHYVLDEKHPAPRPFWERCHPAVALRRPVNVAIWSLATAFVVAMVLVGAPVLRRAGRTAPPSTITLAALRGGEGDSVALGPANRPLEISIEPAELPPSTGYRLAVVNSTGKSVWANQVRVSGSTLSVHIGAGLHPGLYWARLYDAKGNLLREFGFKLGPE